MELSTEERWDIVAALGLWIESQEKGDDYGQYFEDTSARMKKLVRKFVKDLSDDNPLV